MAPRKQVVSLYDLSHKSYVSLLFNSCVGIEQRHGTYDSEECVQAVHDLQNRLVSTVPGKMWNEMCERVLLLIDNYRALDTVEVRFVAVRKIAYALFANERLTRIRLISGCSPIHGQDKNASFFVSSLYKQGNSFVFWEKVWKNLSNVNKIVFSPSVQFGADVWLVAMWMLDVISKSCQDLEDLTIPFSLSPAGLDSLLQCTKLRRIASHENSSEWYFNRVESPVVEWNSHGKVVLRVLKSLPHLEYCDEPRLIQCFPNVEGGHTVNLTNLIVYRSDSTFVNITLAARTCPSLQHLEVVPQSVQDGLSIFDTLADSPVNLTRLSVTEVSNVTSGDSWRRFLSIKGVHLLSLKFDFCNGDLDSCKLVELIGECCLNLKFLNIEVSGSASDMFVREQVLIRGYAPPTASDMIINHQSSAFKKLTTLTLINHLGCFNCIFFKWCVLLATNIETLTLSYKTNNGLHLEDFQDMFASERLPQLVNVTLKIRSLSKEIIQCVYDNCPKMRKLSVGLQCFEETDVGEYVTNLKTFIASNNIDLYIY